MKYVQAVYQTVDTALMQTLAFNAQTTTFFKLIKYPLLNHAYRVELLVVLFVNNLEAHINAYLVNKALLIILILQLVGTKRNLELVVIIQLRPIFFIMTNNVLVNVL